MDTSGQSLLAKWSTKDLGLKSSLGESSLQSKMSLGLSGSLTAERKRKPILAKSSIEKKKPLVEKPTLSGSLFSSSLTKSSVLQSSSLGTSSLSSKFSSSGLQKNNLSSDPPSGSLTAKSSLLTSFNSSSLTSNLTRPLSGHSSSFSKSTNQNLGSASHVSTSIGLKSSALQTSLNTDLSLKSGTLGLSLTSGNVSTAITGGTSLGMTCGTGLMMRQTSSSSSKEKKTKSKKRTADTPAFDSSKYAVKAPRYDLKHDIPKDKGIEMPDFVNACRDPSLTRPQKPLHDVNGMKLAFINAVSGSLICQPNFRDSKDLTRQSLSKMAESVVNYDPEFIVKVALYTRKELNIRTTANFLLALSANINACRPYLKKYYCASIALPSDWIEVAEIYQAFYDRNLSQGSLPSALRKVMIMKFPEFDKYQLAKYNKDSSKKKKKKVENKVNNSESVRGRGGLGLRGRGGSRGRGGYGARGRGGRSQHFREMSSSESDSDSDQEDKDLIDFSEIVPDEVHTKDELSQMRFSIKQLIRKLHITEPVDNVMSLIGKKYPMTLEEFYKSKLPGTWEEERAGKRMKLPIPETWETQVSLKGNKAETWQDLIDHKKLPFMAMLRNLRNLIKAGISQKHHNVILRRLTDERQVANSKQFPFQFFSAYEVLGNLEKEYETVQKKLVEEAEVNAAEQAGGMSLRGRGRGRGGRGGRGRGGKQWWIERQQKKKADKNKTKETEFDTAIINRYRKAIDTAVKIATVYNVQPIRGRTIVMCDTGEGMNVNCTAARGLGKPRKMVEVGLLLGLMCKYSCEECDFVTFDEKSWELQAVEKGTILDNLERILNKLDNPPLGNSQDKPMPHGLPDSILTDRLRDRIQIDNVVLLSGGEITSNQKSFMSDFLKKYRLIVNSNLLYVNISFAGKGCGFSASIKPEHDNDIYISGYSDAILRFIAERGEGGQLIHVEKIDEAFALKPLAGVALENVKKSLVKPEVPLMITSGTPSWRTVRVFISSTFRDMHGERDVLTRFVFPELRALGKKHFINVQEVDLRWGITEEESKSNRTIELCLSEINKSQFFVGILGNRYGYVPNKYNVSDKEEFDWLKDYPPGASVTELEMHLAALSIPSSHKEKAFFFIRDSSFEKDLPKVFCKEFIDENERSQERLEQLKNRVRKSGLEVFDGYPCHWVGVVDEKPILGGLDQFAVRVLNNLWNGIQKFYPDEDAILDEATHASKQHQALLESHSSKFVGRKGLIKECISLIQGRKSELIMLCGKAGTGKTAFMSALVHSYIENKQVDGAHTVIVHIVGAAPGSTNLLATLRRLCHELKRTFSINMEVPEDFKNVRQVFSDMLSEAAIMCGSPLVVFIDGIDMMENAHQPQNMEWLPKNIPKNVVFVLTALDGGKCFTALKRRNPAEITVGGLDMFDKADVARNNLAVYRKKLDESPFTNQLKLLMGKRDASNPFFLKLACEELRVFGKFEMVTSKLKSLPQTVSLMLQDVLNRLESDLGQGIVSMAMSLLVCAREGLMPDELHDLLSLDSELGKMKYTVAQVANVNLTPDVMLPPAVFAHLCRSLQTFLNPTESLNTCLSLAHTDVEVAVRTRYMKGGMEQLQKLHCLMAGYFHHLAHGGSSDSFSGNSVRAFSELPYHMACCGDFKTLTSILCNLSFIQKKCELGLGNRLLEDYQEREFSSKTLEREQQKMLVSTTFQEYRSFVSRNLYIISRYPSLTWQQAANEPSHTAPADAATHTISTHQDQPDVYMLWENKQEVEDPNYLTLSNLAQPVTSVAVSPGGQYFVCGGLDCLIHLYDFHTGQEIRSFHGHSDVITDVCFAGRNYVCSASLDNTVSVWDANEGHRVHVLKGHRRRVKSIAADAAGKHLATGSWDCTVNVYNVTKGQLVCDLKVGSAVNSVSFHPEGQLIVTGTWDSTIRIWDIFHKTRKAVLRGHMSSVRDVAYSPCGRYIASAALDGDVKLWESSKGSQVGNVKGHSLPINKLTFSPTGRELITVSDDHKVKVWSGHLGKLLHCIGNEEDGAAKSIALSPDGCTLAVGYHEGFIRIYDVVTGYQTIQIQAHSASVRCISFSVDGVHIVSGSDDCHCYVYTTSGGKLVTELGCHSKPIMCITATKSYIAIGMEDCQAHMYPADFSGKVELSVQDFCTLRGQNGPITSCTFNQDRSMIATASRDSSVFIWNVLTCLLEKVCTTPVKTMHACHADWITDCKWSNTGDFLVTASTDFTLKIWDVKTGEEKYKLTGHMASINSVSFSYGCIVSACSDGSVKVWSQKGTEITTLHGHTQCANACALMVQVSEDSLVAEEEDLSDWSREPSKEDTTKKKPQIKMEEVLVASCSEDGTVRLWNPLQANELANLTGHADKVLSVSSDTHGHLCTSSLDKSVRLWKPTLNENKPSDCHNAEATFTTLSKNGQVMLSGSRDGIVKIWCYDETADCLTCVHSVKAHNKSVNTACFIAPDGSKFVSGGDDNQIIVWRSQQLLEKKLKLEKWKIYICNSPVTSVLWNDKLQAQSGRVFFSCDWTGTVSMWNTDSPNVNRPVSKWVPEDKILEKRSKQMALNLRVIDVNTGQMAVTMSDSVLHTFNANFAKEKKTYVFCPLRRYTVSCVEDEKQKVPEHKRELNMIMDATTYNYPLYINYQSTYMEGKRILCVDSKGQLTFLFDDSSTHSIKIHDGAVSCIKFVKHLIFTASHDRTIKVWTLNNIKSFNSPADVLSQGLQQVGQFFCPAPVTCMEVQESSLETEIMCGDQLGNIHFFTAVSPISM